ncbi:MAG: hypothetical protein GXO90_01745 [FCB group bacterium]|nr:hypothetical protein [FCB group bacterium]
MKRNWIKDAGHLYFLTNTVRYWLPVFCYEKISNLVYSTWEYYRKTKNIKYYAYVIMSNHLHYIIWLPEGNYSLSDFQRDFKKYIGRYVHRILLAPLVNVHPYFENFPVLVNHRVILKKLSFAPQNKNHTFSLWRSDDKPLIIESENILEQKMNYIELNPIRGKLSEEVNDYPFSSAYRGADKYFVPDEFRL